LSRKSAKVEPLKISGVAYCAAGKAGVIDTAFQMEGQPLRGLDELVCFAARLQLGHATHKLTISTASFEPLVKHFELVFLQESREHWALAMVERKVKAMWWSMPMAASARDAFAASVATATQTETMKSKQRIEKYLS